MKRFIELKKVFILSIAFMAASCHDLDEVNINPNGPSGDKVQPGLMLPAVQRDFMNAYIDEVWTIGNTVMQYTAKTVTTSVDRYAWGDRLLIWDIVYDNVRELNIILNREDVPVGYKGIALVLRAWMFSLLTDCYGDVPFTKATHAKEGIVFPAYDTQEEIYTGLLSDLAQANTLLTGALSVSGDIIYNGDPVKWRKLANSLRLRLLMRMSSRLDVSAQMKDILNNPAVNPIFFSNSDNAVYTYLDRSPDLFPLTDRNVSSFSEWRAGKTLLDSLVSYDDSRLTVYFRPTPATEAAPTTDDFYAGIPNGMSDGTAATFNGGQNHQSRINALFYESANSARGRQTAKGIIMTYAELQFILAEAAARGIITGDVPAYYRAGIDASFTFYGLIPGFNYFTQAKVQLTEDGDENIRKIVTQKWISLFFHGLESWFDWRRTGIPDIKPGVENQNDGRIPVRLAYPLQEQSLNRLNWEQAVQRQGPDDINTRVWWDVN